MALRQLLCADGRRLWFFVLSFLLLLAILASVLIISSMQYNSTVKHSHEDELYYFKEANYTFCYALNISVIVLCVVQFFVLVLLWIVSEKWFWPKQRLALMRDRFELENVAQPFEQENTLIHRSQSLSSVNTTRHGAISTTSL